MASAALAAAAAVIALINGTRPTGAIVVDAVVLPVLAVAVVEVGRRAPHWLLIAVSAVNLIVLAPVYALTLAAPATALSVWSIRDTDRTDPARALSLASTLGILSFAGGRWPFGVTTGVGAAIALVTIIAGWRHLPSGRRPVYRHVALGAAGFAIIATGLFAVAALGARSDLDDGSERANAALERFRDGDVDRGITAVTEASEHFDAASDDLHRPWTWPAMLVPGVAQHRNAAADLSAGAADSVATMVDALDSVDLDRLSIDDGTIDVDAIVDLREPVASIRTAIDDLGAELDGADSPWLLTPAREPIDEVAADIERFDDSGEALERALAVLPGLLGAEEQRTYFVMFTTPGEARGQGGFMSSYTTVTVDDGRIEVGKVGRTGGLNTGGERPRRLDGPARFLELYGQYGFNNASGGTVGSTPWSNITISPDFPTNALVTSKLFPQSGGTEVDGVISLDVYALAAIVDVTGPVEIPGHRGKLNGENLVEFLLVDQYEAQRSQRLDGLELIAQATVDRVLDGGADPFELGTALAPMAQQQRVMIWTADEEEAELFADAGIDGALFGGVDTENQPAFAVRGINASGSKIDSFLKRSMCVTVDEQRRPTELRMTVTNTAPKQGLPDYVIGNVIGLPTGTNRLIVSFHSTAEVTALERDGEPLGFVDGSEHGANMYRFYFDLASGESTEVVATFDPATSGTAPIAIDPQPLVLPERWAITDDGSCGKGRVFKRPGELG